MNANPALALIEQARSFPAIVAPISQRPVAPTLPASLARISIPLASLENYPLSVSGDFIYIDVITPAASAISIGPIGRPPLRIVNNKSFVRIKDGFNVLQLKNENAFAVTVVIFYGYGEFRKDGLDGDIISVVPVGGPGTQYSFTRPANVTPYTVGDFVGELMSFSSLVRTDSGGNVLSGRAKIISASIEKSTATILASAFRLYIFNSVVTVPADNAPYPLAYADRSLLQTYIDFPSMNTEGAGSDAAVAFVDNLVGKYLLCTGGTVRAVLTARDAYVPGNAEAFTIRLVTEFF